jgi:hypothetical protein
MGDVTAFVDDAFAFDLTLEVGDNGGGGRRRGEVIG